MGVDAEELIIRPFREVVERGAEAVANAEADDADPEVAEGLAKAARAVVREGERALKKLQPIWDGQVEKYGDAFKDAMIQQGKSGCVQRRKSPGPDGQAWLLADLFLLLTCVIPPF